MARPTDAEHGEVNGRFRRGRKIGGLAARHALRTTATSVATRFKSEEQATEAREQVVLRLADDIAAVAGGMRGAAHKLGQLLGVVDLGLASPETRAEFQRRLTPLFDSAPRWSDERMFAVLNRSLGDRRSRLTDLTGPIAAASIGQVYRATLEDGCPVAVKIKYPNIDDMVRADLKNLGLLVRVLSRYSLALNAEEVVDEVIRQVSGELDFGQELRNQEAFAARFSGHPAFYVPRPISELCTAEVLVTEYVEGDDFSAVCDFPVDRRDAVGEIVYRFYCGEMYRTGYFSADPNPGNMIALSDGRVAFLDYGLCVSLSEGECAVERAVFSAMLDGDEQGAFEPAVEAGFIVDPEAVGPRQLAHYIRSVVGWHIMPGPVTMTPELAADAASAAVIPSGGLIGEMGTQRLVRAHAFGRRNEMAVAAVLGRLGATGDWSAIAREVLGKNGPATPLGRRIEAWASGGAL